MKVVNEDIQVSSNPSIIERCATTLGCEEAYSLLPSQSTTFLALRVLASYVAVTKYTPIAMGLSAVQILSQDTLRKSTRAFFLVIFVLASTLTPMVGIPMGNILLALFLAYAQYKKNPNLFAAAAGLAVTWQAFSVADRIRSFVSGSQGNAGIASTLMSSLLGSVSRRDVQIEAPLEVPSAEDAFFNDALSNLEPARATISPLSLPEASNTSALANRLTQEYLAQNPISAGAVLANQIKRCRPALQFVQVASGFTCATAAILANPTTRAMVGQAIDAIGEAVDSIADAELEEDQDTDECDWVDKIGETKKNNAPLETYQSSPETEKTETLGEGVVRYCKNHEPELRTVRNISGAIFVASTAASTDYFAHTVGNFYDRMWG